MDNLKKVFSMVQRRMCSYVHLVSGKSLPLTEIYITRQFVRWFWLGLSLDINSHWLF